MNKALVKLELVESWQKAGVEKVYKYKDRIKRWDGTGRGQNIELMYDLGVLFDELTDLETLSCGIGAIAVDVDALCLKLNQEVKRGETTCHKEQVPVSAYIDIIHSKNKELETARKVSEFFIDTVQAYGKERDEALKENLLLKQEIKELKEKLNK